MQLRNVAAWIPEEKARLVVRPAPFPSIGDHDVIIRNYAAAVNPVDWKIQTNAGFGLKYPSILGEDVAGEIIEVGKKVKHFKQRQRVTAHALGIGNSDASRGGFQLYPKLNPETISLIPDDLPYTRAAVLPLSISTAAAGLYLKNTLNLPYPRLDADVSPTENPPVLLVWGGSSSVGSSTIQLAVASGVSVITTCSPANYSYCKSLGALFALDYHNPDIEKVVEALMLTFGPRIAGAYDAIGSLNTVRSCVKILHTLGGGKVVSTGALPDRESVPHNVSVERVLSGKIVSEEKGRVAKAVWGEYIPRALKQGFFKAEPEELIVGTGLEYVQKGLDVQKAGVSAKKVVISLDSAS